MIEARGSSRWRSMSRDVKRFASGARRACVVIVGVAALLGPSPAGAEPVRAAPEAARSTEAPKLVKFAEAVFPKGETRSAKVGLVLTIDADGNVASAVVEASGGATFDASALSAVRGFVFDPARA